MEVTSSLHFATDKWPKSFKKEDLEQILKEEAPSYLFDYRKSGSHGQFVTTVPRIRHAELIDLRRKIHKKICAPWSIKATDAPAGEPPALTPANRPSLDILASHLGLSTTYGLSAYEFGGKTMRSADEKIILASKPWQQKIIYAAHLASKTWQQLREYNGLGAASLAEIEAALLNRGLGLGMDIGDWKPPFVKKDEESPLPPIPPMEILMRSIDTLSLSRRIAKCLKNDNITLIGDLIQRTKNELLRIPDFGGKSLDELNIELSGIGCALGMEIPDWPPKA